METTPREAVNRLLERLDQLGKQMDREKHPDMLERMVRERTRIMSALLMLRFVGRYVRNELDPAS